MKIIIGTFCCIVLIKYFVSRYWFWNNITMCIQITKTNEDREFDQYNTEEHKGHGSV